MFSRLFTYEPTEQEQQLIDLVNQLIQHPKTVVKMTPLTDKYYVINDSKHYYILLKDRGIQVTNTKFSFAKQIHPKAYDKIMDILHAYIENDRQQLEDFIFAKEKEMLDEAMQKLSIA